MNILLLGNGFDLAHDLPTSYKDFLGFCQRIKLIYENESYKTESEFKSNQLDEWKIIDDIKAQLLGVFRQKTIKSISNDSDIQNKIITTNKRADELYNYIKNNTWIDYFLQCPSYIGDNWIDFETEISRVVQALDAGRVQIEAGASVTNVEDKDGKMLVGIVKASKWTMQDAYRNLTDIDAFSVFLVEELEKLIRALEIYLSEFVEKINIDKRSVDIMDLDIDRVISFNYTDTYKKVYGNEKEIAYDYIHGNADINNSVTTNNMVLGIDEYLEEDRKDTEVEFIAFKKYFQRIHKATGCKYREWIAEIRSNYIAGMNNQKEIENMMKLAYSQADKEKMQNWFVMDCFNSMQMNEEHNLYIFGHSLDVTDKDILKDLILNDKVKTTVYYFERADRNGNKDNGRKDLGQKITNLVKVIGQDELIRRTGGSSKTIEFRMQSEMVIR